MRTADVRVRRAIAAVAAGRPVVVTDGTGSDHVGYVVFAAACATAELMAFTVRHTSGYVRVALPESECDRLNLPPMCARSSTQRVTVDARGTGTGISAADRARTIAALASPSAQSADFRRPGHVVPVLATEHGVLRRPEIAEAAADLARLAGRREAGVFCEIVSRATPTELAAGDDAVAFSEDYGLQIVSIGELADYRRRTERQVVRVAEAVMPIRGADARTIGFRSVVDGAEHVAVVVGATGADEPVTLHVHVECLTGDVFGGLACHCGRTLDTALATMAARGGGVLVYLRPTVSPHACGLFAGADRPVGDSLSDTVAWILRDLGVTPVRLSDDTPDWGLVMFGAILDRRAVAA